MRLSKKNEPKVQLLIGLKLALTFVIIIGVIGLVFYWVSKEADKLDTEKTEAMNMGYKYSKGILYRIHSYKGRSIEVKYRINNIDYESRVGWSKNPKNLKEGDSISFRYAIHNPKIIITELQDDY